MSISTQLNYDRLEYEQALKSKVNFNKQLLANLLGGTPVPVFKSLHRHYRNRVEFKVWHTGDKCRYAVTNPETRDLIYIDQFIPATENINAVMPQILYIINHIEMLKTKLFAVEFYESTEGKVLVTLIYHKQIGDTWAIDAQVAEAKLKSITNIEVAIIGRSKGVLKIVSKNYVINKITLAGKTTDYMHIENTFVQPNSYINNDMLWWVYKNTARADGKVNDYDLLELYCGSGNFTLQLARNFRKVLATEVNRQSIQSLKWNCENNKVTNIDMLKMPAEAVAECLDKVRAFTRAKHLDLDSYNFKTILVDPPRAGIDEKTLKFISKFEQIIYISCNPETLKQNLEFLGKNYKLQDVAFFDQFPYTDHLEVGVILHIG